MAFAPARGAEGRVGAEEAVRGFAGLDFVEGRDVLGAGRLGGLANRRKLGFRDRLRDLETLLRRMGTLFASKDDFTRRMRC